MSEVTFNIGLAQIPENRLWKILCFPVRKLAGTSPIQDDVQSLKVHVSVMTDILQAIVADLSGGWSPEKRERVQRAIANFTIVNSGLSSIKPRSNPFTAEEVQRLQYYTQKAQRGESFLPDEATDYRQLSERAAREYPQQQWVAELLKIALFIFALYALTQILKSKS